MNVVKSLCGPAGLKDKQTWMWAALGLVAGIAAALLLF